LNFAWQDLSSADDNSGSEENPKYLIPLPGTKIAPFLVPIGLNRSKESTMKQHTVATTAIALAVMAALGMPASQASAQSLHPVMVQASPPAATPTPSFIDAELKVFAAAVLDVQRVADNYLPRLKKATTIEDQQKVEEAASTEMARVVENRGMTATRFSQILELTKVSPALADRVRWLIHEDSAVATYRTGVTD
jgi:hypothetical protein